MLMPCAADRATRSAFNVTLTVLRRALWSYSGTRMAPSARNNPCIPTRAWPRQQPCYLHRMFRSSDPTVVLQVLPSLNTGGVERGTVEIAQAVAEANGT